jgi:lactate permease
LWWWNWKKRSFGCSARKNEDAFGRTPKRARVRSLSESAMIDFLLAAVPIVVLIFVMTKPQPLSSPAAFALAAALAYGIRVFWFGSGVALLNAAVVAGLLEALTPIAILFGAIFFFVAMEKSGAMGVLQEWLRGVSPHPVAQIMLAGWAFIFLIEGAAGFGTPAALAAPVLVGLGFPPLRVAVVCLIFNAIPTTFGAVGTPVWFGFEALNLPPAELAQLSARTATLQSLAALVLPVVALRFLMTWTVVAKNLIFILFSIAAAVGPMVVVAQFNYEFPAVAGGMVGLPVTILLARRGVGLERTAGEPAGRLVSGQVGLALVPLGVTVAILLVTRIPALGLRQGMTATEPHWALGLGNLGTVFLSPALVVGWRDILGQDFHWNHATLYVPSLIPFVLTTALTLVLFRTPELWGTALRETGGRIRKPVVALLGALTLVGLLMTGGDRSSTHILGHGLAAASGDAWKYFAPFLGALGSFFSGSTTISNLTFGGIQASIANDIGMPVPIVLALQCAGAAMGNIICIHNIVSVCAVLSLSGVEGRILKEALPAVGLYGLVLILAAMLW